MSAAEALHRGAAPLHRASATVHRLEPWVVLVPLVVVQWAAVAVFALTVERNGWLFYQGGDQTYYYTGAWMLANGEMPPAWVGHGWSVALAPIALLAGPNVLDALPAIVVLQVGVLLPLALLCVYGIAASFGGRVLGYAAAAAWVAAPFAVIPLWDERYHERYVELFLPQALGLTGLADFPSMVALLASAFFVVRALRTGSWTDALLAGAIAGFAVALKPANGLFLAAPLAALALARRPRALALFAAAVVPSLGTLALWKWLGLGTVPAFAQPEARLAADPALLATVPPATLDPVTRYVDLDWDNLHRAYLELREYFWSVRLVQFLPLAGVVAVARRSLPTAALLALWLGAFFVVKGTYELSTVASGSIFRILMPAFPAYFVLAAAIPLLVPVAGPRLAERFTAEARAELPRAGLALSAAAVVLVLVPLVLVAAAGQAPEERTALARLDNLLLPVDESLAPELRDGMLSWRAPSGGPDVFYRVLRAPAGSSGIACVEPGGRARLCDLEMELVATTRAASWPVPPDAEPATYRVAVAANWRDDPALGDMLALSPPAAAARP